MPIFDSAGGAANPAEQVSLHDNWKRLDRSIKNIGQSFSVGTKTVISDYQPCRIAHESYCLRITSHFAKIHDQTGPRRPFREAFPTTPMRACDSYHVDLSVYYTALDARVLPCMTEHSERGIGTHRSRLYKTIKIVPEVKHDVTRYLTISPSLWMVKIWIHHAPYSAASFATKSSRYHSAKHFPPVYTVPSCSQDAPPHDSSNTVFG